MKKFLLITFIAIAFIACKKDNQPVTPDPQPNPNPPTGKNKLVSKVVTTRADGDIIMEYVYNDQNQITEMHWGGSSTTFIHSDFVLTYNADGTLKRQVRTSDGVTRYSDIEYKNGLPTLITFTTPSNAAENYKVKLHTDNSVVLGGTFFYMVNGTEQQGNVTAYEYLNGNVIKAVDDYRTYHQEVTREFGNKNNAYRYCGEKLFLSAIPPAYTNDLLKMVNITDGTNRTEVYTNTYDTQGYPKTVKTNGTITTPGQPLFTYESISVYTYIDAK